MAKVIVRKKEKEPKKKKKDFLPVLQAAVSGVTAIVAVCGILLSYQTFLLTADEKEAQREAARSNRFASAIEHLRDDSLAIRMGALYELQKLCSDSKEESEKMVSILAPFVREHIEDEKWLIGTEHNQINRDVYLAGDILSQAYTEYGIRAKLDYLQAEDLDLSDLYLQGANLEFAYFEDANLTWMNFDGAIIRGANFLGATFYGAQFLEVDIAHAIFDEGWHDIISKLQGEQQ